MRGWLVTLSLGIRVVYGLVPAALLVATPAPPAGQEEPIRVLLQNTDFCVLDKPGSIPCHDSEYVRGKGKGYRQDGVPPPRSLVQRARDTLGMPLHLVHRLDRGASGCVLAAFGGDGVAAALQLLLAASRKTYVAVVRGEGVLQGERLSDRGWFTIDRPIGDEEGVTREASTEFRFLGGVGGDARCSVVLARPRTGRWHQVRRHLNGKFPI
jgi:tRNA pseudouridine65 synthase